MSEKMTDAALENEVPVWEQTLVKIATPAGWIDVPGLTHPWCAGLAVTMQHFGDFVVTHLSSGKRIGGTYERAGNAALELVHWAAIARAGGYTWDATTEEVVAAVGASKNAPVPFAGATSTSGGVTTPLTAGEWMSIVRSEWRDEFPWEGDDDPWSLGAEALLHCAPAPPAPAGDAVEARGE